MEDFAAAGQAVATSLARAGENALSFLLGGEPARSPPRQRLGSADGVGDAFSRPAPSPDEKTLRRGSSAGGAGRWPPPHLYRPRPGSGGSVDDGGGGGAGGATSSAGAPPSPPSSTTSSQRRLPWHLRARAVARAHAASLRDVAAMRFAYVDHDARWRPRYRGCGGGGRGEGEEDAESEDDDDGDDVAVVVVVAAHFRPRSVTRREALLHSVLVADEVLGGGSSDDDDDEGEDEGENDDSVSESGGGVGGVGGGNGGDNDGQQQQQQQQQSPPGRRRTTKKRRRRPRDFVLVLFGASATVPALSFDAHFFSELHAALPPGHRDPGRMRAFYAVHAGWGLRAWLAALRLSEPGVYGRVELVASLRDLERRFGACGGGAGGRGGEGRAGRVPRPPVHVLAADERRVAAAAAAGQVL